MELWSEGFDGVIFPSWMDAVGQEDDIPFMNGINQNQPAGKT